MEKVLEALQDLQDKLAACSQRDKQIREWQKIFKVKIYSINCSFRSFPYEEFPRFLQDSVIRSRPDDQEPPGM